MITEPITPDLLTVKQAAARAGVSPQAIYQRIDKDLSDYLQVVDGKKMVKATILDALDVKAIDKAVDNRLIDALQAHIDSLSAQIAEKDKQIAGLLEQGRNNQILLLNTQQYLPVSEPPEPARKKRGLLSRIRDRLKST